MTSRPSPPPLGPLHSLRVTYIDYMSLTFATCHLQYLKAVPITPRPTAMRWRALVHGLVVFGPQ